jgi:hypothetical protein
MKTSGSECLFVALTIAGKNDEWKGIAEDPFQNASKDLEHSTKEKEQAAAEVDVISR